MLSMARRFIPPWPMETKFLNLRHPVELGSRFDDWQVCWLVSEREGESEKERQLGHGNSATRSSLSDAASAIPGWPARSR